MIDVRLNSLPGLEHLDDANTFPGNPEPCPNTPSRKKDYLFRVELVRPILGWLSSTSSDGLLLHGEKGAGKSSVLRQLHAYLNRPLFSITGVHDLEFADLLGTKEIVAGDTIAYHGPLVQAAQLGATFLFEEIDRAPETASVGLNSALDGYAIPTLNGGESVPLNPGFRIAATANTYGAGDLRGDYNTANVMDSSLMDRFWGVPCPYPSEDQELRILRSAVGDRFPEDALLASIHFANDVRFLYAGDTSQVSDKASGVSDASIETTISTRSLLRLWDVIEAFDSVENPLLYALDIAVTNKVSRVTREALRQLAQAHFVSLNPASAP